MVANTTRSSFPWCMSPGVEIRARGAISFLHGDRNRPKRVPETECLSLPPFPRRSCSRSGWLLSWRCRLLQALFQSRENINDLAVAFPRERRHCDFLTLHFLIDHRQKALAVLIVIFFRVKFA